MSPVIADSQFQTIADPISNLDRCHRCNAPRSAHGIDWECPPGIASGRKRSVMLVGFAALVALPGIALLNVSSQTRMSLGTLTASAALAVLTLLVCALSVTGRR